MPRLVKVPLTEHISLTKKEVSARKCHTFLFALYASKTNISSKVALQDFLEKSFNK